MPRAEFRFYAELNELLPAARRFTCFPYSFDVPGSVKDMIESCGVPHTEVDLILVNGRSVDFSCQVQDGDRVSVYPVFESLDITPLVRVRPQPLREPRFVLDTHLGRLAAYLRLLGFDTLYQAGYRDEELARISAEEGRILLTRDRNLLKRRAILHGCHVWETNPRAQLSEVLHRFDLRASAAPFTRCLRCNTLLETVSKEQVLDRLPPRTAQHHHEFRLCPSCQRVYWPGAHFRRMQQLLSGIGLQACPS